MYRFSIHSAVALVLLAGILLPGAAAGQASNLFRDDFLTTEHIASSRCEVDTVAGRVSLRDFSMSLEDAYLTTGSAYDVVVGGNFAYVADGAVGGLIVIDLYSGGYVPGLSLEGTYNTSGSAEAVDLAGDYVFCADGAAGLVILDIGDPANPVPVGSYDPTPQVNDVKVDGAYAYLAANTAGVMILDISDVTSPVLVGTCATPAAVFGVDFDGDYVYAAGYSAGAHVIDISAPAAPVIIGTVDTPGNAVDVAAAGDRLYVADQTGGLRIVDIGDPSAPVEIGSLSTGQSALGLRPYLDRVYVAMGGDGLVAVDVSDPSSPVPVESLGLFLARSVAIDGQYAFVADNEGLKAVDISDPAPLVARDNVVLPGNMGDVVVRGGYAYYDGPGAFTVLDVSDPAHIGSLGSLSTASGENRFTVSGDYAFVAADDGLRIIDVSDPTSPALVTTYTSVSGTLRDVQVAGNHAFVSDHLYGLRSIDITNPALPANGAKFELYSTYGAVTALAIHGQTLLVGAGGHLVVVDISDPVNPAVVGSWLSSRGVTDITVAGDVAYLSGTGLPGGVTKLDISDPITPGFVWDLPIDYANAFLVDGFDAFALCAAGAVHYDLSGFYPESTGVYDAYGNAYTGALAGGHLLLKDGFTFRTVQYRQCDLANPGYFSSDLVYDINQNPYGNMILAAMVMPECGPGFDWMMLGSSGYEAVEPGEWFDGPGFGESLTYRGNLQMLWNGADPSCDAVEIRMLFDAATIDAVTDVPGDNGGWARLYFARSGYDTPTGSLVDGYYIWRRVDDPLLLARLSREGADDPEALKNRPAITLDGRTFVESSPGKAGSSETMPDGVWEIVGSVPTHFQDQYIFLAPTLGDSSATTPYNVFCVTTEKTDGGWYCAWPDSGYSVDNIAPGVPTAVTAAYGPAGVTLDWDDAPEADFQFYRIYRGLEAGFVPAPDNLIHETAASAWTDPSTAPWDYHYRITVLDQAGNESGPGSPSAVSGALDGSVPARTALLGAVPNPFNPVTKLTFELAAPGQARLKVYDTAGHLVATLVDDERAAGRHEVMWDGRDHTGRMSAAGVYLYRLEAGDYRVTKRMTLVK